MIDLPVPLVAVTAATAARVFLPDIRSGLRRALRAGARAGIADLLGTQPVTPTTGEARNRALSRDEEATS